VVSGAWNFGFDEILNPSLPQNYENAPRSYITNLKYDETGYSALAPSDLITKKILQDQLDGLVIDNGEY
jgi:hypothetical protein